MLQQILLIYALLVISSALGFAWVIYRDARLRGASELNATFWGVGIFILPLIVLPVYFIFKTQNISRTKTFKNRELFIIIVHCSILFSLIISGLLLPPRPRTQLLIQIILVPLLITILCLLIFKSNLIISKKSDNL